MTSYWKSTNQVKIYPKKHANWTYYGHCVSLNKFWSYVLITGVLFWGWTIVAIFLFYILLIPVIGDSIVKAIVTWIADHWDEFVEFMKEMYINYQYGMVFFLFDPVQSTVYNDLDYFPGLDHEWYLQEYFCKVYHPDDAEYHPDDIK